MNTVNTQNFTWAKQFGGPGNSSGTDIITDAAGNVYTTGFFDGTADFDPGPGVLNLTQSGGPGAYISKLDANGNFIWAKQFAGLGITTFAISFKLQLYDRAGRFIFQTTDPDRGWNGLYNGKPYSTTLFAWKCSYLLEGERPGSQKGTVTLIH